MWVIVNQNFRDKVTGEIHKKGDKINVSKARFEEILKKGNLISEAAKVKSTLKSEKTKD